MKIAIIGAGVSGLTTAYYLKKYAPATEVHIYEKSLKVGGNANTFNVILNNGKQRWVDMGVNDFNKATYKELDALWQELGIMDAKQESEFCSPLINSASYSVADGSYRYYIDENGNVVSPSGSLAPQAVIANDMKNFQQALAYWFNNTPDFTTSVGEWIAKQKFSNDFVYGNLYPRMNGMYFTMENSEAGTPPPSQMPLWMVAHYYILQEGYGDPSSEENIWSRQYFVNGSFRWLEFLEQRLINNGVGVHYGYSQLHVDRYQGTMALINGTNLIGQFDKIIFATHADDTYRMLDFRTRDNDAMIDALTKFSYDSCQVLVHQDNSVLAPQGDCNKTYNIHIYDYSSGTGNSQIYRPYNITYVVNDHQNDKARGINDPLFFVTVNSYNRIDPSLILKQPNGQIASATFKHVKLDFNAMNAQMAIDNIQLHTPLDRDFYYVGSFTRGAGLHVECVIQADEIAKKILDPTHVSEQTYLIKDGQHTAPKYIMDRVASTLNKKPAGNKIS